MLPEPPSGNLWHPRALTLNQPFFLGNSSHVCLITLGCVWKRTKKEGSRNVSRTALARRGGQAKNNLVLICISSTMCTTALSLSAELLSLLLRFNAILLALAITIRCVHMSSMFFSFGKIC